MIIAIAVSQTRLRYNVDGRQVTMAAKSAAHYFARYLPSICQVLAKYLPVTCQVLARYLPGTGHEIARYSPGTL